MIHQTGFLTLTLTHRLFSWFVSGLTTLGNYLDETIPDNPDLPVARRMTSNAPTTMTTTTVHMALALAVLPSTSRKIISMAASLIVAEMRKMTALIVVMALMKKKVAVEKNATLDRGKTTFVKVVTGPEPKLTAASSIDLSICFRLTNRSWRRP